MKRLATIAALPFFLATPSFAADLYGPRYSEREYIEREVTPPRIVEREVTTRKIVEHHHYHHRLTPRVYTERIYEEPRAYAFHDRPFHRYSHWRPRHHYWDHAWRPRHHAWRNHHHRHHW
jgi:hypothetical protein